MNTICEIYEWVLKAVPVLVLYCEDRFRVNFNGNKA